MSTTNDFAGPGWKLPQKLLLRSFTIYAVITVIPFVPSFYNQDFDAGFSVGSYPWRLLDVISQNSPGFSAAREEKTISAGLFAYLEG